ncbi:hypothetical protein M501DRAFT_1015934 [Patellaria atrata CBS 101060]|uniref:C2H2-type domain-containing protein n=1 Tax=Patellaria atrata CBS 101060 TaxID=1346257 RepID=A0A9P4VNK6_9PEZI|nr:hypothetical protein M501DRAFT_1015934 [Patellaria atrata CBS 101060]
MVQNGRDERREAHDPIHQRQLHYYSQTQNKPLHSQHDIVSALASNQFASQQQLEYSYHQRTPQSPPSPPVEEVNKPSLPSISSLLGIADGDRANGESGQNQQQHSAVSQNVVAAGQTQETRPDQTPQSFGHTIVSNPRMTLPPTPPMQPDSVVDGNQSPSATSQSSISAAPYYLGSSLNNMEPHQQRQNVPTVSDTKRHHSMTIHSGVSPYSTSPYATSPYGSSPGAASTAGSFYSPDSQVYTSSALYQQRPLPSNFPPPVPINPETSNNPWQHHHYISASSQAAFPQSQDRYICQTCNKAFSRPSSLRIHSHSHTGEKPFKCPHAGCGKAFSVRSNMKRHERGCHATGSTPAPNP